MPFVLHMVFQRQDTVIDNHSILCKGQVKAMERALPFGWRLALSNPISKNYRSADSKESSGLRRGKNENDTVNARSVQYEQQKNGREFMAKAEALNLIPKEQTGSRKGHRSNLTALNKVISNDFIRARRIPSIITFNDAKS